MHRVQPKPVEGTIPFRAPVGGGSKERPFVPLPERCFLQIDPDPDFDDSNKTGPKAFLSVEEIVRPGLRAWREGFRAGEDDTVGVFASLEADPALPGFGLAGVVGGPGL